MKEPKNGPTRYDLQRARGILQPTAARDLGCFDYLISEVAKALRHERDTAIAGSVKMLYHPRAAYVTLDGYAGRTKLMGNVVGETPTKYRFVPDRDCYRFKRGVMRMVPKSHVRFQTVEIDP